MGISKTKLSDISIIPLQLLAFIGSDDDRKARLLALSGLDEADFVDRAADPTFLAFVMDYALQDQSLIMEFAAQMDLKPEEVVRSRRSLPGLEGDF